MSSDLKNTIRSIHDFPKKGIVFRDITTLLKDPTAFNRAVQMFFDICKTEQINKVACIESRGFIIGGALASKLNAGFIPIRKKGKLPAKTISEEYQLEYGIDSIEVHEDAIQPDDRILLHDDLLATGGTMEAACRLVEKLHAKIIAITFLIELDFLGGRERISSYPIHSLIHYDSE